MERFPFPDNGGRRRSEDRRISVDTDFAPERRSGQDRRMDIFKSILFEKTVYGIGEFGSYPESGAIFIGSRS